jgi:acetyl-CoA synthetase
MAEQAATYLSWEKKWDFVLRYDFEVGRIEWFGGGILNASYNCLDRHLDQRADKTAYFWEGDDPSQSLTITYRELYHRVNRLAAVLQARGIRRGDRVAIYLPMIVELPVAMLACARIGAVHCVIFSGYRGESLAARIRDCRPRVVITADAGMRGGKLVRLKEQVDEALRMGSSVETVIVFDRAGLGLQLDGMREIWWHEAIEAPSLPSFVPPEPMGAEDPLFIMYAPGAIGRPKGLVHTHGGYLLYSAMTTRLTFDTREDDRLWCTSDIGWVVGHSYGVYGPLANGLTSLLFEGALRYPSCDRVWQILEKYRVTTLYTSPTPIRYLAALGSRFVDEHDLTSLRVLGSVGERLNPEAWEWYYHEVGKDRCPIVDTWLQTESGGHMITAFPGVAPLKPGSCSFPFFGVDPIILDADTGEEATFPNQEGVLCIRRPWPGMCRTIYGDHERFVETYFARVWGMYFTGDSGRKDEDGYYWISGRIDDVINVSGHRIGTAEVESALSRHELVAEAAVVGFPHPLKGQGMYAFVSLVSDAPRSEELKRELTDLVRATIGPIATIDLLQWVDGLPRTRSGKVVRRVLQKIASGRLDELGDTSIVSDPDVLESLIRERIQIISA